MICIDLPQVYVVKKVRKADGLITDDKIDLEQVPWFVCNLATLAPIAAFSLHNPNLAQFFLRHSENSI